MTYEEFERMVLGLYLSEIKFYYKEEWEAAMLDPNSNLKRIVDEIAGKDGSLFEAKGEENE